MIEMPLRSSKETDRKLRWGKQIDGVEFFLYIPKWRVPEPWPLTIRVSIEECKTEKKIPRFTKDEIRKFPVLKTSPIICLVESFSQHTKTTRYRPLGVDWEIGEPYIPYSLTFDNALYLILTVSWGL